MESAPLGRAISDAVRGLRRDFDDPLAPVAVVVPAAANGVLARRALAALGDPVIRVWFETPEGLLRDSVPARLWKERQAEPAGWLRVALRRAVEELADAGALGRFGAALVRRGWRDPLTGVVARLEADLVDASALAAVAADDARADDLRERARLLAVLLEAIAAERAEARIASRRELLEAADAAVAGVGAALARGAVVLGDGDLSFSSFAFLRAWLSKRRVVRVMPPASAGVATARSGLSAAAGDAALAPWPGDAGPRRLSLTSSRLFRAPDAAGERAPDDGSVIIARTPDDVRECVECVREIQRGIKRNIPLDRIAVVLPDGKQRAALEEALDRAGIPCTWLVGFPAKDLGAARLLRVAMDVACGDETPQRLYELLAHPTLNLRAALGPDAVRGRGRWRRMLSRVQRAQGLSRIVAGLERRRAQDEAERSDDERRREDDAHASLVACTRALAEELTAFQTTASLGLHARAWSTFLKRLGRVGESRAKLLSVLEPFCASTIGPPLSPREARDELSALLEREVARGSLQERSIRVLPPLYLLGGEFDLVCVLGLSDGRFPAPAREDALLPDELLAALSSQLGRELPLSRSYEDLERRRFAAAVGAARERLWLGVPQLDFERERPTLPSSHALAALSAVLGRRARFSDVDDANNHVRAGSRARTYPPDESDSVGAAEHLVARAALARSAALAPLAAHVWSRGLLQLHRSLVKTLLSSTGGDDARALDAWTGAVPADVLAAPGLDGAPLPASALAQLVLVPGAFFFEKMLGAFPATALSPKYAPLERATLEELLARAARDEHVPAGDVATRLADVVMRRLREQHELGAFDEPSLLNAETLVVAISRTLADDAEGYARSTPTTGALELGGGVPFKLADVPGRIVRTGDAAVLVDVATRVPHKKLQVEDRFDLALSALALAHAGHSLESISLLTPSRGSGSGSAPDLAAEALALLRAAEERARAGAFPVGGAPKHALALDKKELAGDGAGEGEGEGAEP